MSREKENENERECGETVVIVRAELSSKISVYVHSA